MGGPWTFCDVLVVIIVVLPAGLLVVFIVVLLLVPLAVRFVVLRVVLLVAFLVIHGQPTVGAAEARRTGQGGKALERGMELVLVRQARDCQVRDARSPLRFISRLEEGHGPIPGQS